MRAFCLDAVLADSHAIDVVLETALACSRVFAMHFPELLALRVKGLQLRFIVKTSFVSSDRRKFGTARFDVWIAVFFRSGSGLIRHERS
jgi:hypothetical protein